MDDESGVGRLEAKITMANGSPPMITVRPRLPRKMVLPGSFPSAEDVGNEAVNREEVVNALVQGLWIVWRENVVDEVEVTKRNSWTPGTAAEAKKKSKKKRGAMDWLLCRS